MKEYKKTILKIGLGEVVCLTDHLTTNWYPIAQFFRNILFRECDIHGFRDSSMIDYMKEIDYIFENSKNSRMMPTWFISEEGLCIILQNTRTNFVNDLKLERIREQGLYDACTYFNIKGREYPLLNDYSAVPPILDDYNDYAKMCISTDNQIDSNHLYKRCRGCNKFYPNTFNYFASNSNYNPKKKCRECEGKEFIIANKAIKKIYDIGGVELFKDIEEQKYCKAMDIIYESGAKYAPEEFYNKDVLMKLIYYIQKTKKGAKKDFTLKFMTQYIHIPIQQMRRIIGNSIEIGYLRPSKIQNKRAKYYTENLLMETCKKRFNNIIHKNKIPNKEIEPVLGILINAGLVIICKNPQPILYAKTYQFYPEPYKMNKVLKAIEGISENGTKFN